MNQILFSHDLIRRSTGLTAYALAKRLKIPHISVYNLLKGHQEPTLSRARILASALGLSLDSLIFPIEKV